MNPAFTEPTDCPHCAQRESKVPLVPVESDGSFACGGIGVHRFEGGVTIGGPVVGLLFKACAVCGYLAPFSATVVIGP